MLKNKLLIVNRLETHIMKHLLLTTIAAVVLVGCGEAEADRALRVAAIDGNIEAAKQAIADGADVNAKDDDGRSFAFCGSAYPR